MNDVLLLRSLTKNYGPFQALKGLDLLIKKGQCVGLLGSNGAGKSTTIRIITGQLRPTSGEVRVLGVDPSLHPKKIHPFIGYIPDSQTLYDDLTVSKNIEVFSQLFGKGRAEVDGILQKVQLTDKRGVRVRKLSKGLRQRVLIARALVHSPEFIILDEPTTGLDPSSSESIYHILEDLKANGATILLTTHLMNDVDRLCDHVVFINHGCKVEEGSPAALKSKHSLPTIEVEWLENGHTQQTSIQKVGDWLQQVGHIQARGEILRLRTHEPKLEDIFIKLVAGEA
jgi:ABC-2 type transport system ATP-binding protein